MPKEIISRKQFIQKVGFAAGFGLLGACAIGCTKMDNPPPPVPPPSNEEVDFTLDLTAPENAALMDEGGFVVVDNRYVVAKDELGEYIAATRLCSHEQNYAVEWNSNFNEWACLVHGATFDKQGNGTTTFNNLGQNGIAVYNTELNGNLLRVFS